MRKLLFQSFFRGPLTEQAPALDETAVEELATALKRAARRRLGRSLSIREVDAGSCNGCELEIHALNNAYYDVERFGLRFVASPRHADVLLGPTRDEEPARGAGANLSCDPRPEMGRCDGRLRAGWRRFAGSYAVVGGVSQSFPSTFIFPVVRRRPLRSCRDCSPCSIKRPKPPLRLEALETTSTIPGRLDRGGVQAGSVCVMTPLVILFAQYRNDDSGASGLDPAVSLISLLPLIYVVLAAGVALTKHRYVTLTTTRIRHASHLMSSSEPDRLAGTLAICLFLASIGCASYALQPPPGILVAMDLHFGPHAAAPILWSALISVCVAGFGANAHAATDAAY